MIPVVRRPHSAFPDSSTRAQISFALEHCHTMASAFFSMAASIMDTRFSGSTSSWGMAIVRSTPDYPLSAAQNQIRKSTRDCSVSFPPSKRRCLPFSQYPLPPPRQCHWWRILPPVHWTGCQAQGRHTSQQDSPQGLRTKKEHIQHKMPYALLIFYF